MKKYANFIIVIIVCILCNSIYAQNPSTATNFNKIRTDLDNERKKTYEHVSQLFKSVQYAISRTDSVITLISTIETSNLETVDKAVDILENQIKPIYTNINQNDSTNSKLLKNFKKMVFDNTYLMKDILSDVQSDLARHENKRARLLNTEPKNRKINSGIINEDRIIKQLALQLKYLEAAQQELINIQSKASVTEDDIDLFILECKNNEEFLSYAIITLKIYHDVEQFLKDVNSLASIKEIARSMHESLDGLNNTITEFVNMKIEDYYQKDSRNKKHKDNSKL